MAVNPFPRRYPFANPYGRQQGYPYGGGGMPLPPSRGSRWPMNQGQAFFSPYQQMTRRQPAYSLPFLPPPPYSYRGCSGCGNIYRGGCTCDGDYDRRKDVLNFKTKDVAVRGISYKVRKSFLDDNGKFEGELTKYVDKKKEKVLPDKVVEYLVDLINDQPVYATNLLDLVSLNILASNMAVKSVMTTSLKLLEEEAKRHWPDNHVLTDVIGCIFLSGRVDDALKEWLKDHLKKKGVLRDLEYCSDWHQLVRDHPEVERQVLELMGKVPAPDDSDRRIQ